jgi:hypothetical protein
MKNIKLKRRIDSAVDAFFAGENPVENNIERFRNESELWQGKKSFNVPQNSGALEKILKQIFLYFPGTFILYAMSLGFAVVFVSAYFRPSGVTMRFEMIWMMLLFLAAILMTWLGLGDVRKPKHLVIPASIIAVGVCVGAVVGVLITIPFYGRLFFRDSFPFYILPLALIVPFLAKGLVDRKN